MVLLGDQPSNQFPSAQDTMPMSLASKNETKFEEKVV